MKKIKITDEIFEFIKDTFEGVDENYRFKRLTKNDIVVKRKTKNISPSIVHNNLYIYDKKTNQLMFTCNDCFVLSYNNIYLFRHIEEKIEDLCDEIRTSFNKNIDSEKENYNIYYNFFFRPKKA